MLLEKFLYSVITTNDDTLLYKIKDEFIDKKSLPILTFVQDHYAQYKKMPDLVTVESKFSTALQSNTEKTGFWYTEIIKKYRERVIEETIIDSAKDKKNALARFQQAIVSCDTDVDTKIVTYSDSNRRITSYKEKKLTKGITYFSTGSSELDVFSLGIKRADLWTIGGAEGAGKTWFILRMANWFDLVLMRNNVTRPILIISGEMDAGEIEDRLDAIRCEVSYALLSKGGLTPAQESKYTRYLRGFESNIIIVDSFDNIQDIKHLRTVYRPALTFIDGSHLFAKSYEWQEIAKVTAGMKKMTRIDKSPIINSTHLKSEKGNEATGGSLDDFAYSKGYTRDSDIAGVLYASDMMQVENKIGIDWVKVRRGSRSQIVWENNYDDCTTKVISVKTGAQIYSSGPVSSTNIVATTGNPRRAGNSSMNYSKP